MKPVKEARYEILVIKAFFPEGGVLDCGPQRYNRFRKASKTLGSFGSFCALVTTPIHKRGTREGDEDSVQGHHATVRKTPN